MTWVSMLHEGRLPGGRTGHDWIQSYKRWIEKLLCTSSQTHNNFVFPFYSFFCKLIGAKPLPETMLTFHQKDVWHSSESYFIGNAQDIDHWNTSANWKFKITATHCWGLWAKRSMMTSSNGNIFRVTGHLCGEFTGPRWIPHTKASDAVLWCFFDLVRLVIWDAFAPIMTSP